MKLTSRISKEDIELERLKDIVAEATDGTIEPASVLSELINQVDDLLFKQRNKIYDLESKNISLTIKLEDALEDVQVLEDIANGNIEYDEDLDHATSDFIQSIISSGAADTTFDGEISFASGIVLSAADLKPYVREAIETWVRCKFAF